MNSKHCLVLPVYTLSDPPSRYTVLALQREGWEVTVVQPANSSSHYPLLPGIHVYNIREVRLPRALRHLTGALRWLRFGRKVNQLIKQLQPDLVVSFMLQPLAFLPSKKRHQYTSLACIYDIPSPRDTGRLDRLMFSRGWHRLHEADVVWASDPYKAQLAQQFGALDEELLVCYNCPMHDMMPDLPMRDPWLRDELRSQGATLGHQGGSILLRAGAVGEVGGIEETLRAMCHLPEDFVFLMMGRPTASYREHLQSLIRQLGLEKRAFIWEHPSDEVWKKALSGADIGHLIHGPFETPPMKRLFDLNSSLSNNRLFEYMAASLPILIYDDPRLDTIVEEVPCFQVARVTHLKEDIEGAWRTLGNNAAMRQQLGTEGRVAHLRKYHWENQFAPVMSVLAQQLTKNS